MEVAMKIQKLLLAAFSALLLLFTLPQGVRAAASGNTEVLNYFVIYKYNMAEINPNVIRILDQLYDEAADEGIVVDDFKILDYGLWQPPNPWFYYVKPDGTSGAGFDVTGQNDSGGGMYGYFSDPRNAYILSVQDTTDEHGHPVHITTRLFGSTWIPTVALTIDPASGEAPLDINAECGITDTEATVTSYEFDPGDGSPVQTSPDGSFSHTYQNPGSYQATCTAYADGGAGETSVPVTVSVQDMQGVPPVIDSFTVTPASGYAPLSVTLTCNAHDPDGGDIESIEWYLGDSQWPELTTDNNFTFTHEYTQPGTYTAHCVVWDEEEDSAASDNITITVNPPVMYHQLSVTVDPGSGEAGTVTSNTQDISCPGDCSENYVDGAEVLLTASPADGFIFSGWTGDCAACAGNQECTVTMDADKTCSAAFVPASYFADAVISYTLGSPSDDPYATNASIPQGVIGEPDWSIDLPHSNPPDPSDPYDQAYVNLGVGGEIVVSLDNWVTNGDGVDLIVYEIGACEKVHAYVSSDLQTWIDLGEGTRSVGMGTCSGNSVSSEWYYEFSGKVSNPVKYIKLIDARWSINITHHGADIDAVEGTHPALFLINSFAVEPSSGEAPLDVTVTCQAEDSDGAVASYEFNPGDGNAPLASDDGSFSYTYTAAGAYQATCTAYDDDGTSVTSTPVTVTVEAPGPVWTEINGIDFTRSRTLFDRINHCFFVFMDISNNTSTDLEGPVRMVLESSSLDLKTDGPGLAPDGTTEDGKPYFLIVPDGQTWTAGETMQDERLDFVLQRKRLDFELKFEQLGEPAM